MRQEIWIMKSEYSYVFPMCFNVLESTCSIYWYLSLVISSDIWWLTFLLRICSINSTVLPKARSEHSKVHCKKKQRFLLSAQNTISKNFGPHQSKFFKTRKYMFVSAVIVYQSNKWSYMLVLEFMLEMTQLLVQSKF